jgi:hypothetical protein
VSTSIYTLSGGHQYVRGCPQRTLDQLLAAPPEDVIAMFQNDLRRYIADIESGAEILSEKELAHLHDQVVESIKRDVKALRAGCDYISLYVEKRHEMLKSDDADA